MTELTIRIASPTTLVRAELRQAVEAALLGEERERAVVSETNSLVRPKGDLDPDVTSAALRQIGSFVLVSGAPASGKSTIAARIRVRLKTIQRQHTPVLTRTEG